MAAAFHASGSGAQTSSAASFSITCTISAGDAVTVFGSWDSASTTTPTVATTGGTGSDAFSLVYGPFTSGAFKYGGWLLQSAGTGRTGATVTWASSNPTFADGYCESFTGLASCVLDQVAFATNNTAAISSGNTPTLTSSDEFCIGYAATVGSAITSANTPWTSDAVQGLTGSFGEHQVVAATTAVSSNFTGPATTTWISFALTFKAGATTNPFYKQWDRPGFDLPGITPQHYVRSPSQFPNPIPFSDQQQRHTYQVPLVGPPQSLPLNINLFKNPIPFSQTDWAPQKPFYRVSQQTQPYNNELYVTTVVASPFYTQDFATSHTIPDWAPLPQYTNLVLQNFSTPFYTQDFSKSFIPVLAKYDQQTLNVNLFTNPIPFNQYEWGRTAERTILPDINLLNIVLLNPPVTGTPFSQLSWPSGSVVPLAPFDVVNMVLFTPDVNVTAPFAQYDWSHGEFLPSIPSPLVELNANLFTNPIPFSQSDWTKYYPIHQITFDNLPNIALLNQVVINPFFSQDFSRPFVPPRAAIDVQSVNTNLFTNPVPLNQIDWSKPYRIVPIASDQNSLPNLILYQPVVSNPSNPLGIYSWADLYKYVTLYPTTPALLQNLTLILPPPPPPPVVVGGWRWIDGVMRMREKQLDRRDQNSQSADIKKAAAVLSKMGGIARAQALTANQRSNIASKAAQARWNPPVKRK